MSLPNLGKVYLPFVLPIHLLGNRFGQASFINYINALLPEGIYHFCFTEAPDLPEPRNGAVLIARSSHYQ